jgi:superfamily II DNA or RNA helicase
MIQSLAARDYDKAALASFGMVVADECHHLSSETFCRALPKIGARVTLGLTATPRRADGLTKVFKWYLGETVFEARRERDASVRPRAHVVRLDAGAAGYGRELRSFRGTVNTAGMINNIAESAPRTALVAALAREIVREPRRQVLVLSGRRAHLEEIHGAIVAQVAAGRTDDGDGDGGEGDDLAASIGYYVGGLSQDVLKASEECRVVLGTYSMASEGLDIRSLNALILATPMSNVTQSVGRVLRRVEPDRPPLVVDLADDFSSFRRQATKRRAIYNREGFSVTESSAGDWRATDWADHARDLLAPLRRDGGCGDGGGGGGGGVAVGGGCSTPPMRTGTATDHDSHDHLFGPDDDDDDK